MADVVLATEQLVKRFRGRAAVDGATLEVPAGSIFALLGPNGAGKTTIMRCALGLVRPTSGTALLFGRPAWNAPPDLRREVGALVSGPGLVGAVSAFQNLWRHARLLGLSRSVARTTVNGALVSAGLDRLGGTPARRLSRGEQQRLALAAAFLGTPRLLVLDEPTEGLDPLAVAGLRERLVAAKDRGATVVLSSHLLSEVEQLATHCAVIAEGRVRVAGGVTELGGGAGRLHLRAAPVDKALAVLTESGCTASLVGGGRIDAAVPAGDVPALVRRLVEAGVAVDEVAPAGAGLEAVYRAAIGAAP